MSESKESVGRIIMESVVRSMLAREAMLKARQLEPEEVENE